MCVRERWMDGWMDEVPGEEFGRHRPATAHGGRKEGREGGVEEKESVTANLYLLRHEIRLPRSSYSHEPRSQSMVSTLIILQHLHLQQSLTANLEIPLPRCIIYIMTCLRSPSADSNEF